MYLRKIDKKGKYYKYETKREGGKIRSIYLGKATTWDLIKHKINKLIIPKRGI